MRAFLPTLSLAACCLAATSAAGECRLRIDSVDSRWAIKAFDPFSGDPAYSEFDLNLVNQGDSACRGTLLVELAGEPWGVMGDAGRPLPYTLVDQQAGRDLTPRTGRTGPAIGGEVEVAAGGKMTRRIALAIDTSHLTTDGVFQQQARFLFRDGSLTDIAQRDVILELDSVASTTVTLAGVVARGAVGRVNLGELAPGRIDAPLQLQIRSTRGYEIGVSSLNSGRLVLEGSDWSIRYGLLLGEEALSLTEPMKVRVSGRAMRSDAYRLAFNIGDVAGKRAGEYRDVITVTVAPL